MVSTSVVLKKATISAIPHTNEERFSVWAEGDTGYLPKKVDFLLFLEPILHIVHVNKVGWFSHGHKLAVRCETD